MDERVTMGREAQDLLLTLENIEQVLRDHPDRHTGNSKVHYVYEITQGALRRVQENSNENENK